MRDCANGPRGSAELSRDGRPVVARRAIGYRIQLRGTLGHGELSAVRMLPHNRSFQLSPGTRVAVLSRGAGAPVAGLVFGVDYDVYRVAGHGELQPGASLLGDVGRVIPLRDLLLELDEFGLVGPALPARPDSARFAWRDSGVRATPVPREQDEDRPEDERAPGDAAAPAATPRPSSRGGTLGRRIRHPPDPAPASNRGKAPAPA